MEYEREKIDAMECHTGILDWYQLFDVTQERKYYLAPERRVYLWQKTNYMPFDAITKKLYTIT